MSNRMRTFLRKPGFPAVGSMETDCVRFLKKIIIRRKKMNYVKRELAFEYLLNLSGAETSGGVVSADERR